MVPVIEIGPWQVLTYNLLGAIALVLTTMLAFRRGLNNHDAPPALMIRGAFLVIISGFAAGFAAYLLPKLPALLQTGTLPEGEGRSIVWGIAGAVAAGLFYCRRHGVPPGVPFDLVALPIPLGLAIGRLGCLAAGCCGGVPTDSWLAMYLPNEIGLWANRFPTQLMSAAANLLTFGALLVFERYALGRSDKPPAARLWPFDGILFLLWLALFSTKRFFIAFVRESAVPVIGPLSAMQVYALIGLVAAVGVSIWKLGRGSSHYGHSQPQS